MAMIWLRWYIDDTQNSFYLEVCVFYLFIYFQLVECVSHWTLSLPIYALYYNVLYNALGKVNQNIRYASCILSIWDSSVITLIYYLSITILSLFSSLQCSSYLSFLQDDLIPPAQSIETTDMKTEVNCEGVDQASKTLPNTPDPHTMPNPASIAPG